MSTVTVHSQSYLKNLSNKTNLVKPWRNTFSKKGRETLAYILISPQTVYLSNLDVAAAGLTIQSSEGIDFSCSDEELTQNVCVYQVPLW